LFKLYGCSYFVAVAAYFSYAIYIDIIFFWALKLLTCGRKYWQYIFQDADPKASISALFALATLGLTWFSFSISSQPVTDVVMQSIWI